MTKHLSKEFKSLSEAEEALKINYVMDLSQPKTSDPSTFTSPERNPRCSSIPLSPIFACSPNPNKVNSSESKNVGDTVKEFLLCFSNKITTRLKTQIIQHLFEIFTTETVGPDLRQYIEKDFVTTVTSGMSTLFNNNKSNLIYHLSKCFEGTTPKLPLDRMPFGMLDYNIRFFASENTVNLRMENHYASWLETMFAQFGHKWLCLFRGPAWQYDSDTPNPIENFIQDSPNQEESIQQDIILEALSLSSIDLDESDVDLDNDSLELVNSTMCNLSLTDNLYLSLESSEDNQCKVNSSPSLDDGSASMYACSNSKPVSQLWTNLSRNDSVEIETGLVNPAEMERLHGITPMPGKNNRRNPDLFNPLKV